MFGFLLDTHLLDILEDRKFNISPIAKMLPILTLALTLTMVIFIFTGNSKTEWEGPGSGKKRQDPRQPGRHLRGWTLPALPQATTQIVWAHRQLLAGRRPHRQHCSPKILQSN